MRKHLTPIAALVLLIGTACQDSAVSPDIGDGRIVSGSSALASLGSNSVTREFTILPSGSRINAAGVFTINFPANSVCDPNVSNGCTPITAPLKVTATVQVTKGRLWVDFSPHLNFVNSPDRRTWVTVSTDIYSTSLKANKDLFRARPGLLRKYAILFATSIGSVPQSESRSDRSLKTHVDFTNGLLWRRILHFSGYNLLTGEACELNPEDPYCVPGDEEDPDEDEGGGEGGPWP